MTKSRASCHSYNHLHHQQALLQLLMLYHYRERCYQRYLHAEGIRLGGLAINMMSGGLASEASGGSFYDGAVSAAVVYLYNDLKSGSRKKWILAGKKGKGIELSYKSNETGLSGSISIEIKTQSDVKKHALLIDKISKSYGVDARLVKVIMYIETTHGWYDHFAWWEVKSILPMNVNISFWGEKYYGSREKLKNPIYNLLCGIKMGYQI